MDEHQIVIVTIKGAQPVQNRILALRPAGDYLFDLFQPVFLDYMNPAVVDLFRRDNHDDLINEISLLENFEGMGKDRFTIQQQILLVHGCSHPATHAGRRN
jgi:hypothetical protein